MTNSDSASLQAFTLQEFEQKTLSSGVAVTRIVRTHGAKQLNLNIDPLTSAGTLTIRKMRPDRSTIYTTNQPGDVTVVASTPQRAQVADLEGAAYVRLQYTPSNSNKFGFLDVSFGWQ